MTALQKAHEVNRKRIELGIKLVIKNPMEKAAERPDSLRLAINAMCYDCIGQDADPDWRGSIRECSCTKCPLWSVRKFQKKISTESVENPVDN